MDLVESAKVGQHAEPAFVTMGAARLRSPIG
jgi:hypothetical protein